MKKGFPSVCSFSSSFETTEPYTKATKSIRCVRKSDQKIRKTREPKRGEGFLGNRYSNEEQTSVKRKKREREKKEKRIRERKERKMEERKT